MGHDWILEMLVDLRSYALANGFSALAAKVDEALRVAHSEIADGFMDSSVERTRPGGIPPGSKAH